MATFIRAILALSLLATAILAKPAKPASKIVGGQESQEHEFPYQISLKVDGKHICGGSLIAAQYVLTAGHCAWDNSIEAVAGEHDFRYQDSNVQRRSVEKIWVHEKFDPSVGPNDVAILRVEKPFDLNEYVGLVNLPKPYVVHEGVCVISGWGSTWDESSPNVLQKAYLPLMDQEQCVEILDGLSFDDSNVCAGTVEGQSTVCFGDSGGPLVQGLEQVGIVSWSRIPCGGYNNPGVYVRVSYFIDWIQDKLNSEIAIE